MITVIGEALVDLVDQGTEPIGGGEAAARPFLAHAGGSPLNVAVGVARLGQPVAFCGRLGRDAFAAMIRAHAVGNRVDLSAVISTDQPSTLAVVSIDSRAQARYDFFVEGSADWQWQPEELAVLPSGTTVVHTGSLASWTQPGDAVIADRVEAARAAGLLITYDPNLRAALVPGDIHARVERSLRAAHLVKVSADDLDVLYPGERTDRVARRWLQLGPQLLVVTRGAGGVDAYPGTESQGPVSCDGVAVHAVDTVGAGDAFMAALLAGLADRGLATPAGLAALSADRPALGGLLSEATVVAAITCERAGADPPTAAELAAWRASH